MSGKNINLNERRGGENKVSENSPQSETLYIPQEVFEGEAVKADVRDDNWAMAEEMDGIIGFEPYDKEKDFKAAEDDGKDMTYYRNKNNETISTAEERWRKRLGLDKEDNNKELETITIPDNPEHEEQNIRDIWTKRARSDVIPR